MEIEQTQSPREIRDRAALEAKGLVGADEVFFVNYAGVDGVNHYTGFPGALSDETRTVFAGLEGRPTLVDDIWRPSIVPPGERNRFQNVTSYLLEIERREAPIYEEMYGPLEATRSCRTRLYDGDRFLGYVGCLRRGTEADDFGAGELDRLNRFAERLTSDILCAERLEYELPSPAYGVFDADRLELEWATPDVRPWFDERRLDRIAHALSGEEVPAYIVVDGQVLRFSELGGASPRVMVSLEGARAPRLAPSARTHGTDAYAPSIGSPPNALGPLLDGLPTAAAIVTDSLRILCTNRRARKLLKREDGLRIRGDALLPERAADTLALRETVGRVVTTAESGSDERGDSPPVVSIARRRPIPLEVLAMPFPTADAEPTHAPPRVLLLIYDPDARLQVDAGLVERLFRLTTTEGFVAARLAEGKSIADIAGLRRCSESTVRTHVKRILQKTDASRQADLVRMILTSPAGGRVDALDT